MTLAMARARRIGSTLAACREQRAAVVQVVAAR